MDTILIGVWLIPSPLQCAGPSVYDQTFTAYRALGLWEIGMTVAYHYTKSKPTYYFAVQLVVPDIVK